MKALARGFVWWPLLDNNLEEITRSCVHCLQKKNSSENFVNAVNMANDTVASGAR